MLSPGSELTVIIEKPAAGGRMIARHEGQVLLIDQAIPGERLRVRVSRVQKTLAYAEPVEILDASPDRRDPGPDWTCGGCAFAHVAYTRQPSLKGEILRDALARIGGVQLDGPIPVAPSPQDTGYRLRARLHVRGRRIGFFRGGTHELCDAAGTRQLLPSTLASLASLEHALGRVQAGSVTDIDLAENVEATDRAVHLGLAAGAPPLPADAFDTVEGVTGLSWSGAGSHGSREGGQPFVTDSLPVGGSGATVHLRHHVQSFFQSNRYLLPHFLGRVADRVPPGRVLDLYAGVGLFAAALAATGDREVVAVEGDRHSAADLAVNAASYPATLETAHSPVEVFLADVDDAAAVQATVLVDPPRTGLSPEALKGILRIRPAHLVYVSCDVATLARDVKTVIAAGYGVAHVEAFDLFPNTAHVESLIVMEVN
jgi:23S rRNA (uracil1939-C5)-methyltransferase